MTVRVVTFGGLQVRRDGVQLDGLAGSRMRAALLVYLAVERSVGRGALMTLLWPDRPESRARHSLSQALYELRQELGNGAVQVKGEVVSVSAGVEADCLEFRDAVAAGDYDRAAALYQGPFLSGLHLVDHTEYDSWVSGTRARLERLYAEAQGKAVARLVEAGRADDAVGALQDWVRLDPLHDEAQHLLVEQLAALGRRTDALRQYEAYSTLLKAELDIEPLDQTKQLVDRIRTGDESPAPGIGPGAANQVAPSPPAEPPDEASLTQRLTDEFPGELELVRPLGRGSMARVFLVRVTGLQRLEAVKVLRPDLAADSKARLRFEREARSSARILHPNVVTTYAAGSLPSGLPYLRMEYVKGRTLAEHLKAVGRVSVEDARRIVFQVADGLAAAHARGVIHRDVRPANVLLQDGGDTVKLSDFGLAALMASGDDVPTRITSTGELVGNPFYLGPEQLAPPGIATEQSDVYSLGMLAYHTLVSDVGRSGILEISRLKSEGKSVADLRDDVNPEMAGLIARCLAETPAHRPSAAEVAEGLRPGGGARSGHRASGETWFGALWRRRIPQVFMPAGAGVYLLYEFTGSLVDDGVLPPLANSLVLATLPFLFLASMVITWFHGEKGPQAVPPREVWLLAALTAAWLVALGVVLAGG